LPLASGITVPEAPQVLKRQTRAVEKARLFDLPPKFKRYLRGGPVLRIRRIGSPSLLIEILAIPKKTIDSFVLPDYDNINL